MKPSKPLICAVLLVPCVGFAKSNYLDWGPYPPVAPFTRSHLPSQRSIVDLIFPLVGTCQWSNDYDVNRGSFRHTGIDIKAPRWTPIVAPISGVLGMKEETFWIYGSNGWAVLGTHLNDEEPGKPGHRHDRDVMFAPQMHPGQRVEAGQFIGYVGRSGNATGPHLHFELYAPGRGPASTRIRNPFPSLKRAQFLKAPRVVMANRHERPKPGHIRLEGCVRKVDAEVGKITVILTAKQLPNGYAVAADHLRYVRLSLSLDAVEQAGGWSALQNMPDDRELALYVPWHKNLDGATVTQLVVSR